MDRSLIFRTVFCALCSIVIGGYANMLSAQQRVGIGTTTPQYLLDVQGISTSNLQVNLNSKVNYTGALDVIAVQGFSRPMVGYGIGGNFVGGFRGITGHADGESYAGTVIGMQGSATGTAGIHYGVMGTATGTGLNIGVYAIADGAGSAGLYAYNADLQSYAGYFHGRGYFTQELRTNKNLIVDDMVGIGTPTPGAHLHIAAGADASYTTNGFIQTGVITGWNMVIDDNEILARNNGLANEMFIQRDGGDLLLCALELGRVGIGLTAGSSIPSGYMLAVDGKIIGEEVRIQNSANWPDYVFEEDYALPSLSSLRKTIHELGHLPNVPSAAEVHEEGFLLGEMQRVTMEKVEELTLYLLQMDELLHHQQAILDRQQALIDLLLSTQD